MRMKALGVALLVGFAAFTTFYWITDAPRREGFTGTRDEQLLEFGHIVFLPDDTYTVDIQVGPDGFTQEVEAAQQPVEAIQLFANSSISFKNVTGESVTLTGGGVTPFEVEIADEASAPQKFADEGETTITASNGGTELVVTTAPPHLQPYGANCVRCHGVDGRGGPNLIGPDLHSYQLAQKWAQTGGAQGLNNYVQWVITLGGIVRSGNINSPMPAWGREYGGPLTRQQIEAVTAMIGGWAAETLANPPPSPVDVPDTVEAGAEVYGTVGCAACHGTELEGGTGPNLQTIGSALVTTYPPLITETLDIEQMQADYDDDKRAFLEAWIRDMSVYNGGTSAIMPAFDETALSDSQLQALITFLLDQTE